MSEFSDKFVEVFDEKGRLVSVLVNPEAEESFAVGTNGQEEMENGKSALRAAVDFYRFGKWNHKETMVGLHLRADANLNAFMATNLGVISAQYDGDLPIPRPQSGWAQVNLRNGRFYLSRFNKEYAELRERKHDFVDAYILGYGIDIRVLPWNTGNGDNLGLASTLMRTWKESDDEKAMALKIEGYKKVTARQLVNKDIVTARKKGTELPTVSGAVVLSVAGTNTELGALEFGRYKVYDDSNRAIMTINWDGSIYSRSQLNKVAQQTEWEIRPL